VSNNYETTEGEMSSTDQQSPGIERTDLQQHDLSIPGREFVHNRVDISPEAQAFKHTRPGEEIIYVLEGSLEYRVEGKPPTTVNVGEVLFVPAETIHAVKNVGTINAAELATYVVEKGSRSSYWPSERRGNTEGGPSRIHVASLDHRAMKGDCHELNFNPATYTGRPQRRPLARRASSRTDAYGADGDPGPIPRKQR
jgi:quercetin dioxygenase-like cupin family protein